MIAWFGLGMVIGAVLMLIIAVLLLEQIMKG